MQKCLVAECEHRTFYLCAACARPVCPEHAIEHYRQPDTRESPECHQYEQYDLCPECERLTAQA